jgi:hypothetical protein
MPHKAILFAEGEPSVARLLGDADRPVGQGLLPFHTTPLKEVHNRNFMLTQPYFQNRNQDLYLMFTYAQSINRINQFS